MKIEKIKVGSATRKLDPKYTIEEVQDLEHVFGDELQKEIDNEVMNTVIGPTLIENGWTQMTLRSWRDVSDEWLAENMTEGYKCFGHYWYFESKADATAFALRWG